MKAGIHPKYHNDAVVTCTCGNTFKTGATTDKIEVEVCSACHPFYTGQMKYVDTAGRVDAFKAKQKSAKKKVLSKTEKRKIKKAKRIQRELDKPETLEEFKKRAKMASKGKKKKARKSTSN